MPESCTVLLVEDDLFLLDATADTLSEGGCTVRQASSFAEAVDALDDCPPAAVLVTDIILDGSASGLDLVREVHSRRPDMVLIVLSGEVRPKSEAIPPQALFCTKPCAPGALLALVHQCGEWTSAEPAAPAA